MLTQRIYIGWKGWKNVSSIKFYQLSNTKEGAVIWDYW